jgi:hypothetical protein
MTNKIALITGATSGIGAAFAKKLASQNYDLIITGRREAQIKQLAAELMAQYKINVEVMLIELAKKDELELLLQKVEATKNLAILINNAGFGVRKKFIDIDPQVLTDMLMVHDYAAMRLMHTALKNMLANNQGAVINVSSIGAFLSMPSSSSYSGTKAYLNAITESIVKEIKDSKVRMQVLCPGITRSDIFERVGETAEVAAKRSWLFTIMTAESVVETSLHALEKNQVICVPGICNKIVVWLATLKRLISL